MFELTIKGNTPEELFDIMQALLHKQNPITVPGKMPQENPVTSALTTAENATPTVPTAEAPQYTIEQISNAGAQLVSMGEEKLKALYAVMETFGIKAATHLKPEQYGAFALELRKLGANI